MEAERFPLEQLADFFQTLHAAVHPNTLLLLLYYSQA